MYSSPCIYRGEVMADEELPATGHQEQGGEVFRIENEEDAWKVFERAISKGVEAGKAPTIVWAGWPNIEVYLPNTPEEGSISASMMEAFLELQKSVYRTHLLLANGPSSRRRLTQIERDQFELQRLAKK